MRPLVLASTPGPARGQPPLFEPLMGAPRLPRSIGRILGHKVYSSRAKRLRRRTIKATITRPRDLREHRQRQEAAEGRPRPWTGGPTATAPPLSGQSTRSRTTERSRPAMPNGPRSTTEPFKNTAQVGSPGPAWPRITAGHPAPVGDSEDLRDRHIPRRLIIRCGDGSDEVAAPDSALSTGRGVALAPAPLGASRRRVPRGYSSSRVLGHSARWSPGCGTRRRESPRRSGPRRGRGCGRARQRRLQCGSGRLTTGTV